MRKKQENKEDLPKEKNSNKAEKNAKNVEENKAEINKEQLDKIKDEIKSTKNTCQQYFYTQECSYKNIKHGNKAWFLCDCD